MRADADIFLRRPVGTSLLAAGLFLGGILAFVHLPIATLPLVDYPTLLVRAQLPGADPSTMASSVSAPLERRFAQIAGVDELNSSSYQDQTFITLQFDLGRSIDRAAQDVQAAIDAARGELPPILPAPPTVSRNNPTDQHIMIIALTSSTLPAERVTDYAENVVAQRLRQVPGVGRIDVQGLGRSAVRIQVDPGYLASLGLSFEDVRAFLTRTSVDLPKGRLDGPDVSYFLHVNDQLEDAGDYRRQIAFKGRSGWVRLGEFSRTLDSVDNTREFDWYNGKPNTQLLIYREPGANIIDTVGRIRWVLPEIERWMPPAVVISVLNDRTKTIRASVDHIEATLAVSILLVVSVVFLFLGRPATALIPCLTVPLSLAGTFGFMFLAGYTLDNLSLMALAVAIGLVVDDSIVVVEIISRRLEAGESRLEASKRGVEQIGPTVVAISLALVAVFLPLIFMSGLIGRLLSEFALTLAAAVSVSTGISLSITPTLCSRLLPRAEGAQPPGPASAALDRLQPGYERSLRWVLGHDKWVLGGTVGVMAGTATLYVLIPKGLFPAEDTGEMRCVVAANEDTSVGEMERKQAEVGDTFLSDPAVDGVASSVENTGDRAYMFVSLKPLEVRHASVAQVIARLRLKLEALRGLTVFMQAVQEVRTGAMYTKSAYQYTLKGSSWQELGLWANRLVSRLSALPHFNDVGTDLEFSGQEARLAIDRDAAGRLGLSPRDLDNALYDAFGQRQAALNYDALAQRRVILEASPKYQGGPEGLKKIFLKSPAGKIVPLDAVVRREFGNAPLVINHQGQFPSVTVSFNIDPGYSLSDATEAIEETVGSLHLPGSIRGNFQGTAKAFEGTLRTEILLVAGALLCVYLILGILYESLIHPLTILSTMPSAGAGALIALMLTGHELDIVGLVGIVLLIGIGAKNAIMIVDFALSARRLEDLPPQECIFRACAVRFRPILMTTLAALFGALPLAVSGGVGASLHQPLGIAVVGGLVVSQALSLYTTPVVYLALDRLRTR